LTQFITLPLRDIWFILRFPFIISFVAGNSIFFSLPFVSSIFIHGFSSLRSDDSYSESEHFFDDLDSILRHARLFRGVMILFSLSFFLFTPTSHCEFYFFLP